LGGGLGNCYPPRGGTRPPRLPSDELHVLNSEEHLDPDQYPLHGLTDLEWEVAVAAAGEDGDDGGDGEWPYEDGGGSNHEEWGEEEEEEYEDGNGDGGGDHGEDEDEDGNDGGDEGEGDEEEDDPNEDQEEEDDPNEDQEEEQEEEEEHEEEGEGHEEEIELWGCRQEGEPHDQQKPQQVAGSGSRSNSSDSSGKLELYCLKPSTIGAS